jgi:hypothetical protein
VVCSSVFCMSPLQLVDVRPHAVAGSLVRLVDGVHYRRLKEAILGLLLRTKCRERLWRCANSMLSPADTDQLAQPDRKVPLQGDRRLDGLPLRAGSPPDTQARQDAVAEVRGV